MRLCLVHRKGVSSVIPVVFDTISTAATITLQDTAGNTPLSDTFASNSGDVGQATYEVDLIPAPE